MSPDDLAAWLRLLATPGVGNETARRLLAAFGLPGNIFAQKPAAWAPYVSPAQARALAVVPEGFEAELAATEEWLGARLPGSTQRAVVTLGDPAYPRSLLATADPPVLLYLHGQVTRFAAENAMADGAGALGWRLAMVGSRNPSPQGAENARRFAAAFARAGVTVVSGMALGIDGASHEGALEGAAARGDGGPLATIAVIGTGIDRVYPARHRELAHRIAERGLIISEYALGTPPLAPHFPKRNRLISGLCQGTLVVEAALASGSLITARQAAEQGRDVFAVPGSIHLAQSRGCHALIREGAQLVETADDVLQHLPHRQNPAPSNATHSVAARGGFQGSKAENQAQKQPAEPENELLRALGGDPQSLEALAARTGLSTDHLQAQLLELELAGEVGRLPGGRYQRIGSA